MRSTPHGVSLAICDLMMLLVLCNLSEYLFVACIVKHSLPKGIIALHIQGLRQHRLCGYIATNTCPRFCWPIIRPAKSSYRVLVSPLVHLNVLFKHPFTTCDGIQKVSFKVSFGSRHHGLSRTSLYTLGCRKLGTSISIVPTIFSTASVILVSIVHSMKLGMKIPDICNHLSMPPGDQTTAGVG